MTDFKFYKKKALQEMRPYEIGESLAGISVNKEDSPELGGMIARNAKNYEDQWYVAKKFFILNCFFCRKKIAYVGMSVAFYGRYKFFCSESCMNEGTHRLKIKNNKMNSNLVDTSTHALKKLLGLPANRIPASLRIAMFKVFKIRKEIKCLTK